MKTITYGKKAREITLAGDEITFVPKHTQTGLLTLKGHGMAVVVGGGDAEVRVTGDVHVKFTGAFKKLHVLSTQAAVAEKVTVSNMQVNCKYLTAVGSMLWSVYVDGPTYVGMNNVWAGTVKAFKGAVSLTDSKVDSLEAREVHLSMSEVYSLTAEKVCGFNLAAPPPTGEFTLYKKALTYEGRECIVKLLVSANTPRTRFSNKVRVAAAKVISITDMQERPLTDKAYSNWDPNFIYEVGKVVEVPDFDPKLTSCSKGIHGFLTFQEAENYYM